MSAQAKEGRGFLKNAFSDPKWDSRIKSANTTRKEMWLGYVIGPYGMVLTSSIVNSYFNQYLTDVLGFTVAKGAWIALFMVLFPVISKLIDAITNLIMSKVIDSTVCRQGKARPWFIISAPLVVITVMMLFWMPFTDTRAQAVWVVLAFNLYYSVAYTMWNMAKELSPALSTRNVNQRKNNSLAATITMNIGTGLVSILFPLILTAVCGLVNGDNAKGYFLCMSLIACIALPLAFVQYFYTKERVTEECRNQRGIVSGKAADGVHKEAGLWIQFKACITDQYWIIFFLVILVTQILANMRNISLVYYSGWVVHGNSYGTYAAVQAKFQMIALSPMGPGLLLLLPLQRKLGRRKCIWFGGILTVIGSVIAFLSVGNGMMIYAGTALAAIGNLAFSYVIMSYMGDVIDHVEWKTKTRADGLTGGFIGAATMFAVGIAQGIFNLGLMLSGYTQPVLTGTSADGIALYADQLPAATNWINFSYQGGYIIIGAAVFLIFFFLFDLEGRMPEVSKDLQERKVAECAALGVRYIPADELERQEIEMQEKEAETLRIQELKELCAKKGLDFEAENRKVMEKREAKKRKKKETE